MLFGISRLRTQIVLSEYSRNSGRFAVTEASPSGFSSQPAGIKKRLHDARGTFATNLRHAGYTRDQIADAMGWRSERVEDLLKVYVDRNAVVLRMRPKNGKGT